MKGEFNIADNRWEIIDTFDEFLRFWDSVRSKTITQQIEQWKGSYMGKYTELLNKQIRSYEEDGLDWWEIAKNNVFPKIPDYIPLMQEGRDNLLKICGPIYEQASSALGLDFNVIFFIYVGIGCGAGWATTYNNHPACLLGLEKIAELRWHSQERLKGLVSHELGHLVHMAWRNEWETFSKFTQDPLFQLYSEGFAQRCEHLIMGFETWNEMQGENWLLWCEQHKGLLAQEYLRRVEKKLSVNDFFGDWLSIHNKRQTGYFLGYKFILWLEREYNIREIATLSFEEVKKQAMLYLRFINAEQEGAK